MPLKVFMNDINFHDFSLLGRLVSFPNYADIGIWLSTNIFLVRNVSGGKFLKGGGVYLSEVKFRCKWLEICPVHREIMPPGLAKACATWCHNCKYLYTGGGGGTLPLEGDTGCAAVMTLFSGQSALPICHQSLSGEGSEPNPSCSTFFPQSTLFVYKISTRAPFPVYLHVQIISLICNQKNRTFVMMFVMI